MRNVSIEIPQRGSKKELLGKFIEVQDKQGNKYLYTNRNELLIDSYRIVLSIRTFIFVIKERKLYVFSFMGRQLLKKSIDIKENCDVQIENNAVNIIDKSTNSIVEKYTITLNLMMSYPKK